MLRVEGLPKLLLDGEHTYNITHVSDFDGMACAVMFARYANIPKEHILFSSYDRDAVTRMSNSLKGMDVRDSLIVFSDLAVDRNGYGTMIDLLKSLSGKNNRVVWLDHHPWRSDISNEVSKYCDFIQNGENRDSCATELVYNGFFAQMDRDGFGKRLAEMAHYGDFNIQGTEYEPILRKISGAIAFMNYGSDEDGLRKFVELVAAGDMDSAYLNEEYGKYVEDSKTNIEMLQSNTLKQEVGSLVLGVGYAKRLMSTQACALIREKVNSDIEAFVCLEKHAINLRSRAGVDCSLLAQAFGGGGHPQAAGAQISTDIGLSGEANIRTFIDSVVERAKQIYASGREAVTAKIPISKFTEIDLRVCTVLEAEEIPTRKPMYLLKLDVGELGIKTVVAGLKEHYGREEIIGKRAIVVANLDPKKIGNYVSEGMLLAADDGSTVSLLTTDRELPAGSKIH